MTVQAKKLTSISGTIMQAPEKLLDFIFESEYICITRNKHFYNLKLPRFMSPSR